MSQSDKSKDNERVWDRVCTNPDSESDNRRRDRAIKDGFNVKQTAETKRDKPYVPAFAKPKQ